MGFKARAGGAAALGAGVAALIGSGVPAGAAITPNIAWAATAFGAAGEMGTGIPGLHLVFGSKVAVDMSFVVNGQSFGRGGFSVPAVSGPFVAVPSSAEAESGYETGTMTNSIAITVDVASGPVSTVQAPTRATAILNHCNGCNALAADYTFVVAPNTVAGLTPSQLSELYAIGTQLNAAAHTPEASQDLANQVVAELNAIVGVLNEGVTPAAAPAASPNAVSPNAVSPNAAPAPAPSSVQQFGSTQVATS